MHLLTQRKWGQQDNNRSWNEAHRACLPALSGATATGYVVLATDNAHTGIAHAVSEMAHALRLPALRLANAGEYADAGRNERQMTTISEHYYESDFCRLRWCVPSRK
jgi:hypothetical protein